MLIKNGVCVVQTAKKQRDGFLDALKGLAILLVVAGHAIQTLPGFDQNVVFRVIYSFHMPLFMFLSGAVAAFSLKPMGWDFIKKKALLLLVPFVAWYLVGYFVNGAWHAMSFAHYIKQWIFAPDYGLWFLWVLFLNFGILALAKNLHKKLGTASYVLVWLAVSLIPFGQFGLTLVKWHVTFFLLGYLIFFYREKLAPYRRLALALCTVAFPVLVIAWHRTAAPDFDMRLTGFLTRHGLADAHQLLLTFYTFAVPLAGIGAMFAILKLAASRYLYAVLGWVGMLTMEIYVSHQYFFQFAQGQGLVHMVTGFVLALGGSLLLALVLLQRSALLGQIFLGGRTAAKRQVSKQPEAPVATIAAAPQAAE